MTETQERFLTTILTRVPFDTIVELHLFPAIRRGTLETGVAVIAAALPPAPLTVIGDDLAEPTHEDEEPAADRGEIALDAAAAEDDDALPSPYRDEDPNETSGALRHIATVTDALPVPISRLRILTASYRQTIKGVERGKWSVDIQDEADAPLDAVEAVLRGVRQRSTEPADPERVSREMLEQLRAPSVVAPAA